MFVKGSEMFDFSGEWILGRAWGESKKNSPANLLPCYLKNYPLSGSIQSIRVSSVYFTAPKKGPVI